MGGGDARRGCTTRSKRTGPAFRAPRPSPPFGHGPEPPFLLADNRSGEGPSPWGGVLQEPDYKVVQVNPGGGGFVVFRGGRGEGPQWDGSALRQLLPAPPRPAPPHQGNFR